MTTDSPRIDFRYCPDPLQWRMSVGRTLLAVICVSFIGCVTRYAKLKETYVEQANRTNCLYLIDDATFFSDVSGAEHVVHLEKSKRMLDWTHSTVAEIVSSKGYAISDWSVQSIGLIAEPGTSVRVFAGSDRESPPWSSIEELELQKVPIALHAKGFDEGSVEIISGLHSHLFEMRFENDLQGISFPSVAKLNLPSDSLLLVTESVAEEIPLGKKLLEAIATLPLELISQVPGWESDNMVHVLSITNPDGVLLWANTMGPSVGGLNKESGLKQDLELLFRSLPDHP